MYAKPILCTLYTLSLSHYLYLRLVLLSFVAWNCSLNLLLCGDSRRRKKNAVRLLRQLSVSHAVCNYVQPHSGMSATYRKLSAFLCFPWLVFSGLSSLIVCFYFHSAAFFFAIPLVVQTEHYGLP